MDLELSPQIIEFAEKNKINGYFVDTVIKTAQELKHTYSFDDSLFPTIVLSFVGKKQKETITEAVDQLMKTNQNINEEYSEPATQYDFGRVPTNIRSRFPENTEGWKVKDIIIQQRWIMYFDSVVKSGSLLQLVGRIINIFRPQILQP